MPLRHTVPQTEDSAEKNKEKNMANRQTTPGIPTYSRQGFVQGKLASANVQNGYKAPDFSRVLDKTVDLLADYHREQKNIAFKNFDLMAEESQKNELEAMNTVKSPEEIPQIQAGFETKLKEDFSQKPFGEMWLQEKGDLKEFYNIDLDNFLKDTAYVVASSKEDKAFAKIGEANKTIDDSRFLTPTEKENTKNNFANLYMQEMIYKNPGQALQFMQKKEFEQAVKDPFAREAFKRQAEKALKKEEEIKKELQKQAKNKMSEEEVNALAAVQLGNFLMLDRQKDVLMDEGEGDLAGYMDFSLKAQQLYKEDKLNQKDFENLMKNGDFFGRMIEAAENYEPEKSWFKGMNSFNKGVDVLKTLPMSAQEKAYAYQRLYLSLNERGIALDSYEDTDKQKAKQIAQAIRQDILEKKQSGLLEKEAAGVLIGKEKFLYDSEKMKTQTMNRGIFQLKKTPSGEVYKVFKDKDGNYTVNSIAFKVPGGMRYWKKDKSSGTRLPLFTYRNRRKWRRRPFMTAQTKSGMKA